MPNFLICHVDLFSLKIPWKIHFHILPTRRWNIIYQVTIAIFRETEIERGKERMREWESVSEWEREREIERDRGRKRMNEWERVSEWVSERERKKREREREREMATKKSHLVIYKEIVPCTHSPSSFKLISQHCRRWNKYISLNYMWCLNVLALRFSKCDLAYSHTAIIALFAAFNPA
jgi:hypothetical protein